MKRSSLWGLTLVIVLAFFLLSCNQTPTPQPNPTYNPYPSPDPSYPLPAEAIAEGSLMVDAPLPTSSSGGTVTGVLMAGDPLEPVFQMPLYLGEVITVNNGTPGVVGLDKMAAPRALIDPNGRFVFLNVPPGLYSLVLDFVIHTVILRNPDSGGDILIDVKEGMISDMGTLKYPALDLTPPDQ